MAEVLMWIGDRLLPEHADYEYDYKSGDVIHVAGDGWPWGSDERADPRWVIVKLPGVAKDTLSDLLSRTPALNAMTRTRLRDRFIALHLASTALRTVLNNKVNGEVTLTQLQITAFLSLRATKVALP